MIETSLLKHDGQLKLLHLLLLWTLFTVHTVYDYMYSLLNTPEKKELLHVHVTSWPNATTKEAK